MRQECHKTRFATREDAVFYLKKIRRESTREVIPVRAYLCRCKAWHLTSQGHSPGELKHLQNIIDTLRANIRKLKTDNALLRQNANNGSMKQAKTDEKVIELQKALEEKDRLVNVLRKHISELLTRLLHQESRSNSQAA